MEGRRLVEQHSKYNPAFFSRRVRSGSKRLQHLKIVPFSTTVFSFEELLFFRLCEIEEVSFICCSDVRFFILDGWAEQNKVLNGLDVTKRKLTELGGVSCLCVVHVATCPFRSNYIIVHEGFVT